MSQSGEEKRAYAKGYGAGKRYADHQIDQALKDWREEQFKQQVFLAILPELVRRPWKTGEKSWSSMDEFVSGAWKFANLAVKRTFFSGRPDPILVEHVPEIVHERSADAS